MSHLRDELELEKSVRRFRETFHGKIAIDKAVLLMRRYANNHRMVTLEVILMKDRELDDEDRNLLKKDQAVQNVVQRLTAEERQQAGAPPPSSQQARGGRPPKDDEDIKELGERLRVLPLTVSRCHSCKKKYDPVPSDEMWGIGVFYCPKCTRSFRGFGRMDLGSPCYTCRTLVTPTEILPPRKGTGKPRNPIPHSCLAEDCYNRGEPPVPGTECVHPRSRQRNRKPRVVNPSPAHISTGSTVNTCLSQGSLMSDLHDLLMDDIKEEGDSEEGSRSGSSSN